MRKCLCCLVPALGDGVSKARVPSPLFGWPLDPGVAGVAECGRTPIHVHIRPKAAKREEYAGTI